VLAQPVGVVKLNVCGAPAENEVPFIEARLLRALDSKVASSPVAELGASPAGT